MTCQFVWWPDLEKCTNLDYFKSFGEIFHVNRSTWSLDNFSFSFSFWEPNSSLLSFVSRVFEEQKPPNIINQEWSGKGSKIRSIRFFFFCCRLKKVKNVDQFRFKNDFHYNNFDRFIPVNHNHKRVFFTKTCFGFVIYWPLSIDPIVQLGKNSLECFCYCSKNLTTLTQSY